jgi:Ca-activated chloride channel family protein
MTWDHPFVLGLIPAALALAWWASRGGAARGSVRFARIRRLWADAEGLHDRRTARGRRWRGLLLALGAALALAALARPQWGTIEERQIDRSREVLLALDLSRSMLADDVAPTRLDRAKLLIDSLLDQLAGERVGLAVFAGTAFLQSPMSADYEVLRDFLHELDPTYLPQGGTNYGAMLQTALRSFDPDGEGDRFLVVLSDGEAHDGEWSALVPVLRQRGVRVVGLGLGTAEGGLVPDGQGGIEKDERGAAVLSRLEPETLNRLAAETGGVYRDAATWVDIADLVGATVAQGRAGSHVEQIHLRRRDRYQWLLAPAVLFLMLAYAFELPVLPVARTLRRPARGLAPVRALGPAAALLLAVLASDARAALPAAPANPIEATVAELAAMPQIAAGDYARLAEVTIDVASRNEALTAESRLPVIDDALLAVDAGEQADASAADWPELRRQLEDLKQATTEEPESEREEDESDASEPEKQSSQEPCDQGTEGDEAADDPADSANGESGSEESDASAGASEESPERDGEPAGPEPQEADPSNPGDGGAESQVDAGGEAEARPQSSDATDAPPTAPDEAEESSNPTRLVGGGPVHSEPAEGEDIALAEALDRMQRIADGDSPATLFDRMNRAEAVPPPPPSAKNW